MADGGRLESRKDMSKYIHYLFDLGYEVKLHAREAVKQRNAEPAGSAGREFESGCVLAFHTVITIMQQKAEVMGIPLSELRLDDIVPDRDLT